MRANELMNVIANDAAFANPDTRLPLIVQSHVADADSLTKRSQSPISNPNTMQKSIPPVPGASPQQQLAVPATASGGTQLNIASTPLIGRSRSNTMRKGAARPNVNNLNLISQKDIDLLRACQNGDIDEVYNLLWAGANVNCRLPFYGSTPLMIACRQGNAKIVNVLIEFGAQVKPTDEYSVTALHWAANSGRSKLVNLIVSRGNLTATDISQKDAFGSTPLHFASVRNLSESVFALIKSGCDPAATNNDGRRPSELTTDESIRAFLQEEESRTARSIASNRTKKTTMTSSADIFGLPDSATPGQLGGSSRRSKRGSKQSSSINLANTRLKSKTRGKTSSGNISSSSLLQETSTPLSRGSKPILSSKSKLTESATTSNRDIVSGSNAQSGSRRSSTDQLGSTKSIQRNNKITGSGGSMPPKQLPKSNTIKSFISASTPKGI